jgi:hypothetical protein
VTDSLSTHTEGTFMKKVHAILLGLLAVTTGATFSLGAQAQGMTKAEYTAEKDKISATYKTDRAACDADKGNAKDICIAQAKGKEKVDKADLEDRYKPSEKMRYKAHMAKADADYAVAKERCDDQAGMAKETCEKEAKAAHATAKTEAKTPKK